MRHPCRQSMRKLSIASRTRALRRRQGTRSASRRCGAARTLWSMAGGLCAGHFARGDMVECDDPPAIALAHQPRVDAVLRILRAVELVAADELGGVRRKHLDLNIEEAQAAARLLGGAVVTDVVVERALPVLLELAAGHEDHVGVREALHVAAKVAAVPGGFHAAD